MKPAMMGLIGPMALLLATLTAVNKASGGGSPSADRAGGSRNRTAATAPRSVTRIVGLSSPIYVRCFGFIRGITSFTRR
jgi:hypothetical protein